MELFWQYSFVRYAFLAGLLIGFIAPLVGSFVVVRRISIIADALAHVSLSGIALGFLLGSLWPLAGQVRPTYYGLFFAIAASLAIEKLRQTYRHFADLAIPIILSTGVGLGVVLIGLSRGVNIDLLGLLFGNILAVTPADLWRVVILGAVVLSVLALFYKELLAISFDEEAARVAGLPIGFLQALFSAMVAVVVMTAIQLVGILLVSALITIPVAAALRLAKSFRQLLLFSVLLAEMSVLLGLWVSFQLNLATGGTIVLASVLLFLGVLFWTRWREGVMA
ncbi:MAG: metal ABC transporter permease [Bacillota bacterium]|nr:metal ABC transporter permease [Bacillota bacterium]